jgi:glutamate synthase (NADPH/NADH) small chain
MSEYKIPTTETEFEQNFAAKKPLMDKNEAFYESSRCLFCYDAPCIKACPTGIDIPLFIRQINTNNLEGAAQTIYDSNYFGHSCGQVCPTDVLCEGACVYNHQDVKPIEIGRLQAHATNHVIENNKKLFRVPEKTNGKKVAIIGSGAAGIACACELRLIGYTVDIYEAKDKPSGLTIYGIAPYKLTNQAVMDEMDYLQKQFGYTIKYNSAIKTKADIEKLEKEYDAVFIGIGLGNTSTLGIKGEDHQDCVGATEFIEVLRMQHHKTKVGKKVIVLGGGNTAIDAASEAARMGAEKVILAYRRSKEEMSGYDFEYDLAKLAGASGLFNVSPLEIIITDGKIKGVKFIKTTTNNQQLTTNNGTEFIEECDMVIRATGQLKQTEFLSQIKDLHLDKKGRIVVNEKLQTSNPKYFAGGDVINGGKEVVNAAADGKAAAKEIHKVLVNE